MRDLTDVVKIGGQLSEADVQLLAGQGIKTIINNRPDNEAPFQVSSSALAQIASDHGITYYHIPMAGGVSPDMIKRSIEAYSAAQGPVMAFCKSGMRSAALWCFAHVKDIGVDDVLTRTEQAGFNLETLRASLNAYLEETAES